MREDVVDEFWGEGKKGRDLGCGDRVGSEEVVDDMAREVGFRPKEG